MKYITTFFVKLISKEIPKPLGRWNIDYCATKINNKILLANEDHCGPCGQYAITKIENANLYNKINLNMSHKVNLYGTSKYVIHTIINNNAGNGFLSNGTIYDTKTNNIIFKFKNIIEYSNWWNSIYGTSEIGLDEKYIMINFP